MEKHPEVNKEDKYNTLECAIERALDDIQVYNEHRINELEKLTI